MSDTDNAADAASKAGAELIAAHDAVKANDTNPTLTTAPPIPSANPPIPKPDQTAAAQAKVEDDINLIPSAAQILDPETPTSAPIADPSQRGTPASVEAKFGPSAAELADAQHSAISPKPFERAVPIIEPSNEDVPHPTLPHAFAALGDLYNRAIALGQSLESHCSTLEQEGEAEMHAVALRMKTLMDDMKSGVETIEAQMSSRVRAAIESMSRF